ncbi:MAG TPA: hypothetical protein VK786_01885 [bacterium]|jgi:hypothetical protein|nr:hypothetical protein [bacterium]
MAFLVLPPLLLFGAPGVLLWRLYSLEAPRVPLPPRPPSRPGLWYCSHRADVRFPFQHLFIRITPSESAWAVRRPDLFGQSDADGTPYCTLGAGPREGKLFLEFNRSYDLRDPVSFEEPIPCRDAVEENARISALLDAAGAYGQSLEFAAWSRISGPGYNCNSMIHELAGRAGLPGPDFARHFLLCPGIGRGLPKTAFREPERP